jgi:YebC/PmpR family DNA-binding regulatory protein
MAGHSKWNNIKNRKAAVDSKKGKIFSNLSKLIRVAVKEGESGDPDRNSTLRMLLDKAREANMPKKKIKNAIDCALGKGDQGNIKEVIYEAFGPGGIGLMIVCLTDNNNRTASDLRYVLSQKGGSLGSPGSVVYMFKRSKNGDFVSTMQIPVLEKNKQELRRLVDDLVEIDDVEDVYCVVNID